MFFLSACKNQQQVKAKIFERKELGQNRLVIKYKYLIDNKIYIDSASVRNTVIGNDSINIIIDVTNPAESLPDL
jgi:hypothetical protein